MTAIPTGFDHWAQRHFSSVRGIQWRDACPAYALGLLTAAGYDSEEAAEELKALWEELFSSNLDWTTARMIIHDVWRWFRAPRR